MTLRKFKLIIKFIIIIKYKKYANNLTYPRKKNKKKKTYRKFFLWQGTTRY